ncbi:MAG: biotin--[acetyl-CoA-carboxylase] ligase [Acidimicrobiales bacterium]
MFDAGAKSRLARTRFGDVRWFEAIDSTNAYLLDQARHGAPEGVVAVADYQGAGRGRMGRVWMAPPGASLLASMLFRPNLAPDRLHLLTVIMALAAADACATVAGVEVDIKWPNDLLFGSRKVAGILAEADLDGATAKAVVVGIGLNLSWPEPLPDEISAVAVTLSEAAGRRFDDRAGLLVSLLEGLEDRYADLAGVPGQSQQVREFRSRCTTLGRSVRVDLADESFTGTASDLSVEGHLLVDIGMCLRTVTAGDVVHLRPLD